MEAKWPMGTLQFAEPISKSTTVYFIEETGNEIPTEIPPNEIQ